MERINRDRMSDMALSILKARFIQYTQDVANKHGLAVEAMVVGNSVYEPFRKRWVAGTFYLPRNPFTGKAVLLVPKRFLRELPTLNSDDWFDYSESTLRDDVNLAVMENVDSKEIVRLARHRSELIRGWTIARETQQARPYNVDRAEAQDQEREALLSLAIRLGAYR